MCSPYQTFTKGLDLSKAPDIIHSHSVIGVLLMSLVGFHASACRIKQSAELSRVAPHSRVQVASPGMLKVPVYAVAVLAVLGGLRPRGEKPNPKLMNLWNAVHSVTGYITAGR